MDAFFVNVTVHVYQVRYLHLDTAEFVNKKLCNALLTRPVLVSLYAHLSRLSAAVFSFLVE